LVFLRVHGNFCQLACLICSSSFIFVDDIVVVRN
jgi:hypothetical protein